MRSTTALVVFILIPAAGQPQRAIGATRGSVHGDFDKASEERYTKAVRLVRTGRNLAEAVSLLEGLARRSPEVVKYRTALICACVSRCASLAVAQRLFERYHSDRAVYESRLAAWESAIELTRSPLIACAAPRPPLPPETPDDHVPVVSQSALGNEGQQLTNRVVDLIRELAPLDSKITDAEVDEMCGWGLLILLRDWPDALRNAIIERRSRQEHERAIGTEAHELASRYFERVTRKRPDDPAAWVAFALSTVPKDFGIGDFSNAYIRGASVYDEGRVKAAIQCLKTAEDLRPANLLIESCLANLTAAATERTQCETHVSSVARLDARNAVPKYQLAELHLRKAVRGNPQDSLRHLGQAMKELERGNAASDYAAPTLSPTVPSLLEVAWRLRAPLLLRDEFLVGRIVEQISELLRSRIVMDRPGLEVRIAATNLAFGLKLIRHASGRDLNPLIPESRTISAFRATIGAAKILGSVKAIESSNAAQYDSLKSQFVAQYSELAAQMRAAIRAGVL